MREILEKAEKLFEYAESDEAMKTIMHYGWTKAAAKKILETFMSHMLNASAFGNTCRQRYSHFKRKNTGVRVSWEELHHRLYSIFD